MPRVLKPIWQVGAGSSLFIGPLDRNAPHAHSVPVLLGGLYEPFRLRIAGTGWHRCRAAVVPAGVSYEFNIGGSPLAVLYLEPTLAGADALVPLVQNAVEAGGALVAQAGELSLLRELYEDRRSMAWVGTATNDLLTFSNRRIRRRLDERIARVLRAMDPRHEGPVSAASAARSVGLSSSRFQHLFAEQVGVPFRRYRTWHRLRLAIGEAVAGSNLTAAAHTAGFSDQAHFAHSFRRTFGAPASPSLLMLRSLTD
ncbi:MAG TPA: helix-turn-helix domain-containing protein [Hyphomicrobiaceae bacterium]|nr:helix-turn-helix domain-containing protein [Hyphomicrobiaceae bacterium]